VRYVRDTTGRFGQRPHFEMNELDEECEHIITSFMQEQHGRLILPIPTDDLTKLIERDADDLDLYADLSDEGPDVEGITYFRPGQKPRVRIASGLSEPSRPENRLRTTLTHEYGHVKFHDPLWQRVKIPTLDLFAEAHSISVQKCQRAKIINAAANDWMEWQAGYICGALLMPVGPLRRLIQMHLKRYNLYAPLSVSTPAARELIAQVASQFIVSQDAARVRLTKMGHITEQAVGPSLFSQGL
jgi:hypothetical protein